MVLPIHLKPEEFTFNTGFVFKISDVQFVFHDFLGETSFLNIRELVLEDHGIAKT